MIRLAGRGATVSSWGAAEVKMDCASDGLQGPLSVGGV